MGPPLILLDTLQRPENTKSSKPKMSSYKLVLRLFMVTAEQLRGSKED
jgi:hypothetical protein